MSGTTTSGNTSRGSSPPSRADAGDVLVRVDMAGTAVFVVTAVLAAAVFSTGVQWVAAITAMTLFILGIAAFVWSFWNAVQRSRGEEVAVTQLYLLAGGVAPSPVRRVLLSLLLIQVVVGLGTALARPNAADGSPGSSLALGVLVPVFGFGINGLWAAFHGTYDARTDTEAATGTDTGTEPGRDRRSTSTTDTIDQNEDHG